MRAICARAGDPLRLKEQPPRVINCLNGELWIGDDNTVELRQHRAESYLTYCLAATYDPAATCPLFDQTYNRRENDQAIPQALRLELFHALYEVMKDVLFGPSSGDAFWAWHMLRLFRRWADDPLPEASFEGLIN